MYEEELLSYLPFIWQMRNLTPYERVPLGHTKAIASLQTPPVPIQVYLLCTTKPTLESLALLTSSSNLNSEAAPVLSSQLLILINDVILHTLLLYP